MGTGRRVTFQEPINGRRRRGNHRPSHGPRNRNPERRDMPPPTGPKSHQVEPPRGPASTDSRSSSRRDSSDVMNVNWGGLDDTPTEVLPRPPQAFDEPSPVFAPDSRRFGRLDSGPPTAPMSLPTPETSTRRESDAAPVSMAGLRSDRQTFQEPFVPHGPVADDRLQALTALLDNFTASVASTASLTIQRDVAKKELARREYDFDRSRRHHNTFAALAEQQANSKLKAQKQFEQLSKQLSVHTAQRHELSITIATRILSYSSGHETETLKRVEGRLDDTSKAVSHLNTELGGIKSLQPKIATFQRELDGAFHDIAALRSTLSQAVKNWESQTSESATKVETDMTKLQDDIDGVKKAVKAGAAAPVGTQQPDLEFDGLGLAPTIVKLKEIAEAHFRALRQVDNDLDTFETKVEDLDESFQAVVERGVPNRAELKAAILRLQSRFEAFRAEEITRDGMLADEFEKTEQDMTRIRTGVDELDRKLKEGFESSKKMWEEARTAEKVRATEANGVSIDQTQTTRDTPPTTQSVVPAVHLETAGPATVNTLPLSRSATTATTALANVTEAREPAEGSLAPLSLPELATRHSTVLLQHAEFLDSLNLKIDNLNDLFSQLTTDRLAQLMLGQLSQVFPHASTMQSSFERLGQDLAGLNERSHSTAKRLEELSSTVERMLEANSWSEADQTQVVDTIIPTHSSPSPTVEAVGQEQEPEQAESKQQRQDPNRGEGQQPPINSAAKSNKGEGSIGSKQGIGEQEIGKQGIEAEKQDQVANNHQLTGTTDDLLRELQKCIDEVVHLAQGTAEGMRSLEAQVDSTLKSTVDEFAVVNILLESLYAQLGIEMTRPILPAEGGNDDDTIAATTAVEAATSTHDATAIVTSIETGTIVAPAVGGLDGNSTAGNGGAENHDHNYHNHQVEKPEQKDEQGLPEPELHENNEKPDNGELRPDGDNEDRDFDPDFDPDSEDDNEEVDPDGDNKEPHLSTKSLTKRKRRNSSNQGSGANGGGDTNDSDGDNRPKLKRTRIRNKARPTISSDTESDSSNKDPITAIKTDDDGHLEDKDQENKGKVEKKGVDNGNNDHSKRDDHSAFTIYNEY